MQVSVTKVERVAIRATVADRLIHWHAGEIQASWFADQLVADPVASPFVIPGFVKWKQFGRDSWGWAQLFAAMAAMAFLIRQAVGK